MNFFSQKRDLLVVEVNQNVQPKVAPALFFSWSNSLKQIILIVPVLKLWLGWGSNFRAALLCTFWWFSCSPYLVFPRCRRRIRECRLVQDSGWKHQGWHLRFSVWRHWCAFKQNDIYWRLVFFSLGSGEPTGSAKVILGLTNFWGWETLLSVFPGVRSGDQLSWFV